MKELDLNLNQVNGGAGQKPEGFASASVSAYTTAGNCPHCKKYVQISVSGNTARCLSCGGTWTVIS